MVSLLLNCCITLVRNMPGFGNAAASILRDPAIFEITEAEVGFPTSDCTITLPEPKFLTAWIANAVLPMPPNPRMVT